MLPSPAAWQWVHGRGCQSRWWGQTSLQTVSQTCSVQLEVECQRPPQNRGFVYGSVPPAGHQRYRKKHFFIILDTVFFYLSKMQTHSICLNRKVESLMLNNIKPRQVLAVTYTVSDQQHCINNCPTSGTTALCINKEIERNEWLVLNNIPRCTLLRKNCLNVLWNPHSKKKNQQWDMGLITVIDTLLLHTWCEEK